MVAPLHEKKSDSRQDDLIAEPESFKATNQGKNDNNENGGSSLQMQEHVDSHHQEQEQETESEQGIILRKSIETNTIDGVGYDQTRPKNAFAESSLLSKIFFCWPYPLLQIGMKRSLVETDLPEILETDSSQSSINYFQQLWDDELRYYPSRPNLHRAVAREFFTSLWYIQPFMAFAAAAKVVQAVTLGKVIESFSGNNNDGYLWASLLVLCGAIILFGHHHIFFITWRKGMRLRIAFVAAIYEKSLRLSSTYTDPTSSFGHITNLASNDVERFMMCALFICYLIWAPIQSLAVLVVGVMQIGPAFGVGFAVLAFVFVPLQFYLGGKFAFYRSKTASITDQRVNFVSQAVRGSRVMKMSGYEYKFLERIMSHREKEVLKISKANMLKSWNEALFFSANVVISLLIFIVHVVVMDGTLKQGDVFTVFTLINILQLEMTKHVSLAVMATSELYVSLIRLQKYLEFPELSDATSIEQQQEHLCKSEIPPENVTTDYGSSKEGVCIEFLDVSCYWNVLESVRQKQRSAGTLSTGEKYDEIPLIAAVRDVTIQFRMGELTAVIGSVGVGKSALLQAIVKELPISSGTVRRNYRSLAYAPQDPWIMDGTAKENILMGSTFDQKWYDAVVKACGLVLDFKQLPGGDLTILGDRGVQCSGGQRARIGCARALYKDADVLVLDDPLSAVDAKVGRQIYHEAIQDLAVQRGKCVVVATHQHQYVTEGCRCILVSDGGQIKCIGSYEDCVRASNGKLSAHISDGAVDGLDSIDESDFQATKKFEQTVTLPDVSASPDDGTKSMEGNTSKPLSTSKSDNDYKEMSASGLVTMETYMNYLRAMGGRWVGILLLILFCVTQGSVLVTIATFGRWANRPAEEQDDWNIITLVIGLGCTVFALALFRAMVCFQLFINASQRLHDQMSKAVLRAKIQFFDTNPLGRILNRFSSDVGITDDQLPPTLFDCAVLTFLVLGALATAISTLPFILVAVPFLMWYFASVRNIFVTSTRELKRLEGLARSPIFSMISESLSGIATIRANNSIDFFKEKFRTAQDTHTRAFFSFIASSRWVGFRMDALVFLLLAIVCFLSVLFNSQGWFNVDPSILGLSLSLLIQLAGLFQWCIRQSAEVVNQMVSVERVLQFGKVEPEAELECDDDKDLLFKGWPREGSVEVSCLSARYRESLPLSLNNVSFKIPQGARVGVVGRTGSGKSTLVQTLFRLLEAESGCIIIDGVDISKIGLHALRTKLSVIPQVPTLFSGCTVRENLDLFSLHDDDRIRQVLNDCHLTEVINELPGGWDTIVAESGSNFSVGQRQLLCLARSILSNNRILIMDESTANVDRRTDQLVQETLQNSFKDGTIIAVAHRLDTIIDFDLVVVLGNGRVLEFGPPAELLRKSKSSGGIFASMVDDTGDTMSKDLRQRAFQKEESDRENKFAIE